MELLRSDALTCGDAQFYCVSGLFSLFKPASSSSHNKWHCSIRNVFLSLQSCRGDGWLQRSRKILWYYDKYPLHRRVIISIIGGKFADFTGDLSTVFLANLIAALFGVVVVSSFSSAMEKKS